MAEKKTGLDKYSDVNVPTDVHVPVKLWMFSLVDIGILGGTFLAANKISQILGMQLPFVIATYVVSFGIALFAIIKMPYNPMERNYKTLIYALHYHRTRYWPLDVEREEDDDNDDSAE